MDDYVRRDVALTVLHVCRNEPHPQVVGQALLAGFTMVEEKDGQRGDVHYDPAVTVDQVNELLPKVRSYIAQISAEMLIEDGGGAAGGEEQPTVPDGWDPAELKELQWLSSTPSPGRLRPAGVGEPAPKPALTEEELARIRALAS